MCQKDEEIKALNVKLKKLKESSKSRLAREFVLTFAVLVLAYLMISTTKQVPENTDEIMKDIFLMLGPLLGLIINKRFESGE